MSLAIVIYSPAVGGVLQHFLYKNICAPIAVYRLLMWHQI